MKWTLNLAVVVLCLVIGQGCKKAADDSASAAAEPTQQVTDAGPVTAEPEQESPKAFAYDCDDGDSVVSQHDPDDDEMWVFLPGQTVILRRVPTASGARYANDDVSFWAKGDEAVVEYDGKSVTCAVNRFRSKVESVKLSGGDFWASGNEPGWTLEMYPGQMVFTTNYGEDQYQTSSTKVSEDSGARMTVFRGDVEGRPLVVTLRGEACVDSMSGEEFETTVRIDFGGKVLDGCGAPLH